MINTPLEHATISTNRIRLHVVQAGPKDGKPVILLHGFPEFWYGWHNQIDALANAGFRLYLPDQRGYNLSEKPKEVAAYNLDVLSADVIGLIDHIGIDKARVVGHDWGGGVAWWTANKHPERLEKLAVLNIAHHAAFSRAVRKDPLQKRMSRYIAYMQMPILPELLTGAMNGYILSRWAFGKNHPHFSDDDLHQYQQAWKQPGALTSMMNWYRAIRKVRPERLHSPRISVPTLLIWGAQDKVMRRELAQSSIDLCDNGRLVYIEDAGHWVQHEAADRVNTLLIEWLSS